MKPRKTITVQEIRDMTNTYLAATDTFALHGSDQWTPHDWQMIRTGVASLLESVLHRTGNYRGYGYRADHKIDDTCRSYY